MKKYIAIAVALAALGTASARAQGSFSFVNGSPTVDAPIREVNNGAFLVGSAYKATYYWGAPGTSDASTLTAGTTSQTFDPSDAGYFYGPTVNLSAASTSTVTLQVRAWRVSDGATWAAASQVAGAHVGQGNLIQVALATGQNPPTPLNGLQGFSLTTVAGPEPATIALGLMGASALFIRRRKV